MGVSKKLLIWITGISALLSLPVVLFVGLFGFSNIIDGQFVQFLSYIPGIIISLIPIISLITSIKINIESPRYNLVSWIFLIVNLLFIALGLFFVFIFLPGFSM